MRRYTLPAAISVLALSLTACGGSGTGESNHAQQGFDFSTITPDPAVTALVPADIKARDVLRNGASTDYAPAEFLLDDGTTPTGYEVDMVKAMALTMGLSDGTTTTEAFAALLPKVGSNYDIGASSFTVTPERVENFDMLAYMDMGSLFATGKDNPNNFDPASPCGATVGVQTGTYQETELLPKLSEECTSQGKPAIDIKKEDLLTNVMPKVISGQYDAFLADDPVTSYYVKKAEGQLVESGEIFDAAPVGVVVNRDNQELSQAVKAALDSLLASGKLREIMDIYGAGAGLYSEVKLESSVQ